MSYSYTPFGRSGTEIRILCPVKHANDGIALWRLQTIDIADPNHLLFFALSYEWHPPDCARLPPEKLLLQPSGSITVTGNLAKALEFLWQNGRADDRVWIDAICINQDDVEERNQQVQIMRDIYTAAREVLIWPGQTYMNTLSRRTHDFETLFEEIWNGYLALRDDLFALTFPGTEKLAQGGRKSIQSNYCCLVPFRSTMIPILNRFRGDIKLSENWKVFDEIFSLTYWGRRWISQEILSERGAGIMLKSQNSTCVIDIEPCLEIINFISSGKRFQAVPDLYGLPDACKDAYLVSKLSYNTSSAKSEKLDLLHALTASSNLRTSQPKDLIYSLLGIVEPYRQGPPKVDYSLSTAQVFRDIAVYIIDGHQTLSILACSGKSSHNLPSWAPNWVSYTPHSFINHDEFYARLVAQGSGVKQSPEYTSEYDVSKLSSHLQLPERPFFSHESSILHTGALVFQTRSAEHIDWKRPNVAIGVSQNWFTKLRQFLLRMNKDLLGSLPDSRSFSIHRLLFTMWYDTTFGFLDLPKHDFYHLSKFVFLEENASLEQCIMWMQRYARARKERVEFWFFASPELVTRSLAYEDEESGTMCCLSVEKDPTNVSNSEAKGRTERLLETHSRDTEFTMEDFGKGIWVPAAYARHRRNPPGVEERDVLAYIPSCGWPLLLRASDDSGDKYEIITSAFTLLNPRAVVDTAKVQDIMLV